jgi:hypothetical protein
LVEHTAHRQPAWLLDSSNDFEQRFRKSIRTGQCSAARPTPSSRLASQARGRACRPFGDHLDFSEKDFPVMTISVAEAKKICTPAELELVQMSTTRNIGSLDAKQLKAKIRRARTLRDKWRDQAAGQTRQTKVNQPEHLNRANARSEAKAQLFAETMARFESRLAKVDPAYRNEAAPAGTPAKPVRARGHRAERAAVKDVLDAKKSKLNEAAAAKTAARPAAAAAAGQAKAKVSKKTAAKKTVVKKAAPKRTVKAAAPATKSAAPAATRAGKTRGGAPKASDLGARAIAKENRLSAGGGPRIQGHVSAQNKRNQARRNKH